MVSPETFVRAHSAPDAGGQSPSPAFGIEDQSRSLHHQSPTMSAPPKDHNCGASANAGHRPAHLNHHYHRHLRQLYRHEQQKQHHYHHPRGTKGHEGGKKEQATQDTHPPHRPLHLNTMSSSFSSSNLPRNQPPAPRSATSPAVHTPPPPPSSLKSFPMRMSPAPFSAPPSVTAAGFEDDDEDDGKPKLHDKTGLADSAMIQTKASVLGIDLRSNTEATPPISRVHEFEDGLIPLMSSYDDGMIPVPANEGLRRRSSVGTTSTAFSVGPENVVLFEGRVKVSAVSGSGGGRRDIVGGSSGMGKQDSAWLVVWHHRFDAYGVAVQWQIDNHDHVIWWIRPSRGLLHALYTLNASMPFRLCLSDAATGATSPIFEFPTLDTLFDFQAAVTSARVVLDLSYARHLLASESRTSSSSHASSYSGSGSFIGGMSAEVYTSIRVQVWHDTSTPALVSTQLQRRQSAKSLATLATTTTASVSSAAFSNSLSGPRPERMALRQSRMVIFLGPEDGILSIVITEDIELSHKDNSCTVCLRPRKANSMFSSRTKDSIKAIRMSNCNIPMLGSHIRTNRPRPSSVSYNTVQNVSYATLDVHFSSLASKAEFLATWAEVLELRRKQLAHINQITEEMGREVFTGREAMKMWF